MTKKGNGKKEMRCWFCLQRRMEPMKGHPGWLQCPGCEATFCPKPTEPHRPAFTIGKGADGRESRGRPWGSFEE